MRYPPPERIASVTQLREKYKSAIDEIASLKRSLRAENAVSRQNATDARENKKKAKSLDKKLLTMTAKQKAAEEASKCGYWSGAAVAFTSILYMAWDRVGYPYQESKFGREFWSSEPVFGVISWLITMAFAWMYKVSQDK